MRKLIGYQYTKESNKKFKMNGLKSINVKENSFTVHDPAGKYDTWYICEYNKFFFDDGSSVVKLVDRGNYMSVRQQITDILTWLSTAEQDDEFELIPSEVMDIIF